MRKKWKKLVALFVQGLSDKEIAKRLGYSQSYFVTLRRRLGLKRPGEVVCGGCGMPLTRKGLKRHLVTVHYKPLAGFRFKGTVVEPGKRYRFYHKRGFDDVVIKRIRNDGWIEATDAETKTYLTIHIADVANVEKLADESQKMKKRVKAV